MLLFLGIIERCVIEFQSRTPPDLPRLVKSARAIADGDETERETKERDDPHHGRQSEGDDQRKSAIGMAEQSETRGDQDQTAAQK